MSFVNSRFTALISGSRTVPAFFLILWIFVALCLGSYTLILKNTIQQQRLADIDSSLNSYLTQNSAEAEFQFTLQNNPPKTIDFIRLSSAKSQLLITASNSIPFTGLVNLDPLAQGSWIDLSHPEDAGDWLLISKTLADGRIAQAGTNDKTTGRALYKKAVSTSYLVFLLTVFPCLALAFLFNYMLRYPLRILEDDIKKGLSQKKATLPKNDNKYLSNICTLLEQTFSQNRQLIVEMQSSLDNVAHDLRTPMTRLRAGAEYALQSDKDDPELYRSALSDCLEESERVLSMLKIMMSVAEAESGTMRLNPEEIDLVATLNDVIGLYQYVAEEEQITVSSSVTKENIFILADQTRISQVWANLLDNAIKYGHKGGSVTISAEVNGSNAVVRFHDDGMGISENETLRIWDRLYRGDRSRSKQGLGLGLNYVKAVVEAHGGQVTVTSKIKEGSSFEIHLPIFSLATARKTEITD